MDVAVVHILHFEGGKIVELWDVGQVIPKDSPDALECFSLLFGVGLSRAALFFRRNA